jgi:hypothetical protein
MFFLAGDWPRVVVAQIEFLERTPDNRLHYPKFVGIRGDNDPTLGDPRIIDPIAGWAIL